MLTDIFARRYEKRPLFDAVDLRETRLLVQAYRIIDEQIWPYYGADKKVDEHSKAAWTSVHDRLTMELGLKELSPKYYSYVGESMGKPHTYSGWYNMNTVCETWLTKTFDKQWDENAFMKNRLSFVELAFREREAQVAKLNANLAFAMQMAAYSDNSSRRLTIPGFKPQTGSERVKAENDRVNATFAGQVHELNTRFGQAGMPLHYHNGYIQITQDALTQAQIATPFWALVKDPKWVNVNTDMAEAIDRRDTGGRDPAFYAGKALESTIKIICADKGWTTDAEKGASDFLNHLESKANRRFIEPWERHVMQAFFSGVRNDFGHGPGPAPMPVLTDPQTDSAIELSMSCIKSLITRL